MKPKQEMTNADTRGRVSKAEVIRQKHHKEDGAAGAEQVGNVAAPVLLLS